MSYLETVKEPKPVKVWMEEKCTVTRWNCTKLPCCTWFVLPMKHTHTERKLELMKLRVRCSPKSVHDWLKSRQPLFAFFSSASRPTAHNSPTSSSEPSQAVLREFLWSSDPRGREKFCKNYANVFALRFWSENRNGCFCLKTAHGVPRRGIGQKKWAKKTAHIFELGTLPQAQKT